MSASVDRPPQRSPALRLHRQLAAIWATGPGLQRLAAVNHSVIGLRFMATAFIFFAIGGVLGMLTRVQLATPTADFMAPETYNQVFTMHGSMMLFLFAIPLVEGVAVYLTPKILGARDLAFPRLTAFWLLVLPVRRHDPDGRAARRSRAGYRLVHVHAAQFERLHARHERRRLVARRDLRRNLGAGVRRGDHRLNSQNSGAGHVARPDADLRLVHADHRPDDGGGVPAADPRFDPARGRAGLPSAIF